VDYTIVQWIAATLEGHLAVVNLGGFSKRIAESKGCSQRGVLSPLLWCTVVDYLIIRLNGGGIHTQGDANDIYFLAVEKFQNIVSGLIQWTLHTTDKWCNKVRLLVNPNKTGLIVFTRRKLPGFFAPHFFWGYFTSLYVDQVAQGSSGFLADFKSACGCQGKKDSQFAVGL
jgi:hypothetical protein